MRVILVLLALLCLLVESSLAAPQTALLDPYTVFYRHSRMSSPLYDDDDDEDDDEDDDDYDDDEFDDDIYPPDFSKLFPNPDGRPVGPPDSDDARVQYGGKHPVSPQHGRPSHGPASMRGPAAMRGPIQAQHGQRQGGIGRRRPAHDGPPPNYRPVRRGPPPRYRSEIIDTNEIDNEVVPQGRQLPYAPKRRVVNYPMRRVYNPYSVYPQYPVYRRHFTPVVLARSAIDVGMEDSPVPWSRAHLGRFYNPWSRSPLKADAYNPQFVFNPTTMRARRVFRYHPSQRRPNPRMSLYSGRWGNPRQSYVHGQTGAHYGGSYWASRF